ncbi:hypothetical protein MJI81_23690, partial [Salmonella enterica subsp. enterica serovar Anatum]|nr:hypothetical protein [Salmonella enterica subsp. enterica serovar Anatum]
VLAEIPRVREDLGFIPLVTPTSQIVGTQAVLNVLTGERYKTIAKETAGILKGEYGHTPVPVNVTPCPGKHIPFLINQLRSITVTYSCLMARCVKRFPGKARDGIA